MSYVAMEDEAKIEQSIRFIALGQPLPQVLETFLKEAGLYELLVKKDANEETSELY